MTVAPAPRCRDRFAARALVALLALTAVALPARANEAQPPTGAPPAPNTNPMSNPTALFGQKQAATASAAFGRLDGDYYLQLTGNLDLNLGKVGLGLQVPINLLLWNTSETITREEKTHFGVIRKADWPVPSVDNYSNYLRLVRYARYGQKREPLYVHYGQMFGSSLGHGTILDRYNNSLDVNRPRSGLALDVNTDQGGIETFANDIAWPSTNVIGTRVYVRPLAFLQKKPPVLDKWAVGVSVMSDRRAPSLYDADGTERERAWVVRDGAMVPVAPRPRTIVGFDTEIEVLRNSIISLIPYADLNLQLDAGAGFHLGTQANFRFPLFGALNLWSKLEYRAMQRRYVPSYFDALYDLQRFAYPVTVDGAERLVPKADVGRVLPGNGGLADLSHGILGEATAEVLGMVQAGATYFDTPGQKNAKNLMLFATLPKFDQFKVSAYFVRKNFDDLDEIVALDERSVLTAAALYKIFGPLYFLATFTRTWRPPESGDPDAKPVGVNDWNFGLQTYIPL